MAAESSEPRNLAWSALQSSKLLRATPVAFPPPRTLFTELFSVKGESASLLLLLLLLLARSRRWEIIVSVCTEIDPVGSDRTGVPGNDARWESCCHGGLWHNAAIASSPPKQAQILESQMPSETRPSRVKYQKVRDTAEKLENSKWSERCREC